jgi:hypothetical protein
MSRVRISSSARRTLSRQGIFGTGAYTVGWPRGEAAACKAVYTGSNPVPTSVKTIGFPVHPGWQWAIGAAVARFPDTEEVTGSIPVSPTKQGNLLHAVLSAPAGNYFIRGRSSAGRAPPCQGGCREFESRRPLSSPRYTPTKPVVRFRAIGAAVARFPDTEEVTGSIPVSPTAAAPRELLFCCPFPPLPFPGFGPQHGVLTTKPTRQREQTTHPLQANAHDA